MDFKTGGEDLPPSYEFSQHAAATSSFGAAALPETFPTSSSSSITGHLQSQVASLPLRIRASQLQARTAQQRVDDTLVVELLAPEVAAFLADLGDSTEAPLRASLTIVPDGALPKRADLSGLAEMRAKDEDARVKRVVTDGILPLDGEKTSSKDSAEDSYASFSSYSYSFPSNSFTSAFDNPTGSSRGSDSLLWWGDETMAHRLAASLRPKTEVPPEPATSAVQAVVEQELPPEKQRKGWGWSKMKSGLSSPQSAGQRAAAAAAIRGSGPQRGSSTAAAAAARGQGKGGARMTVEAQNVAFRVESDMGILGSENGWAIVVTVTIV